MSALEYVKTHPYMTAGSVFVGGVLLVLLFKGHNVAPAAQASTVSGYDPGYNAAVVSANSALMQAQLAMQGHSLDTQAALQAHLSDNNTSYDIASLTATVSANHDNLAANVASQAITADVNKSLSAGIVTDTENRLMASVDSQAIAAGITTQQLTNQHDINLAGISRDVALAVNARGIQADQDAATVALTQAGDQYSLGVLNSNNQTRVNLTQLDYQNAANSRTVALDDTLSARQHIENMTGYATSQFAIQTQANVNADNNSRLLAAQTIQVNSNNLIDAQDNAAIVAQTKINADTASNIASTQAHAATDQAIVNGIAGVAKVGIGAFV